MHSLRRTWHWVRSQNKTLFSTRFLFQWQFFSSYLNSSCNMIFGNVDHFLNSWRFIMRETGKVSQIILNYQERILHLSNFFSKPDIFPWKIEGTGGIFLSIVHDEEIQENFVLRHFKEDSEIFRPLIFSLFPENDGGRCFELFWVFEEVLMKKQGQSCSSSKKVWQGDDHLLFGDQVNFT